MALISINLNEHVYLKMTEREFKIWHKRYNDILPDHMKEDYPLSFYTDRVNKETGLVEMQIHEFIDVFKDTIGAGQLLPCNGNLIFDLKDFKNI